MDNLLSTFNDLGFLVANTFSDILRYVTETEVLGYPLIEVLLGSGITITLGIIIANFFRE